MKQTKLTQAGVWKLLKKNISKAQLAGYVAANIVGLSVILAGILFFCDSRNSGDDKDNYFSNDYIVISKKVTGVNLDPVSFNDEEIADLEAQPWVQKVGKFTSSGFTVYASIEMAGRGLSTYLFFESVPDEFFDTKPEGWDFDSEKKFVPIILNKDYLALYNFGFAIPQGLPQVSEDIISAIPMRLRITDGDRNNPEYFDAAVVGFSSRLNTIAVPQQFMEWANNKFSPGEDTPPSRLIMKIDRMQASEMGKYMTSHSYEIGGDKESGSKISDFLGIVSGVVTINGLIISLLAVFILLLSIFLLLQKSRGMLRNLILLGYAPAQVGVFYERLVIYINLAITGIAIGVAFICRAIWSGSLEALGLGHASVLPMLITAALYFVIVSLINVWVIRNHLMKIWHNR